MIDHKRHADLLAMRRRLQQKKPLGLGGMIKAGLSAIGITEERVSKAIGKPCGCGKRAAKLDKLGHMFGIGKPPSPS
jgi:hypothetical protein